MVSEKLCVLGDSVARDRLDPIGRRRVLARAHGPRNLRVGDVTDEPVTERELGLPFDRRQPGRPNEIPAHELMQAVAHRPVVEPPTAASAPDQNTLPRTAAS